MSRSITDVSALVALFALLVIPAFCSAAYANTLTFDQAPSGVPLGDHSYARSHRVVFTGFQATNHTGWTWGTPHSGNNVMTSTGAVYGHNPAIMFGVPSPGVPSWDHIQSVSAYFSTDVGVMIRITAYHSDGFPDPDPVVTSVVIGAAGESWNNRYVEIAAFPGSPFECLGFEAVNSTNDLLGFSADDMTIVVVPEPSSLAALALGAMTLVGGSRFARRRRG